MVKIMVEVVVVVVSEVILAVLQYRVNIIPRSTQGNERPVSLSLYIPGDDEGMNAILGPLVQYITWGLYRRLIITTSHHQGNVHTPLELLTLTIDRHIVPTTPIRYRSSMALLSPLHLEIKDHIFTSQILPYTSTIQLLLTHTIYLRISQHSPIRIMNDEKKSQSERFVLLMHL